MRCPPLLLASRLGMFIENAFAISVKDAEVIVQELNQKLAEYFKANDLKSLSENSKLFVADGSLHVNNKKVVSSNRDQIQKYYEAERKSGVKVLKYLSQEVKVDVDKITAEGRFGLRHYYEDTGPWDLGNYSKVIVQDPQDHVYRIAEETNNFYKTT